MKQKEMKYFTGSLKAAVVASMVLASGCASPKEETPVETAAPTVTPETTAEVVPFSTEYTVTGTTSSGKPKSDTFVFEGETTDGIITSLNFDIIRNKGTENEYSKKDIYGYLMNISDAEVSEENGAFTLNTLTAYGYDTAYAEGSAAQYMVSASAEELNDETVFGDLVFHNDANPDQPDVALDKALIAYSHLAKEAGIEELSATTPVKDILSLHGLYKDGSFVAGKNRVSFAGYHGGRSYGEQMDAIVDYILANNMTLEDVYEMFRTVNQPSEPIEERDTISGATISFVGDFQRMAYMAAYGELFEGVTNVTKNDDGSTKVEVVTQGFGGEIETHVTFDADKRITAVTVRDAQETEDVGAKLYAEDSTFLEALVEGQDDIEAVESVSGASVTSAALKKAVQFAKDEMAK